MNRIYFWKTRLWMLFLCMGAIYILTSCRQKEYRETQARIVERRDVGNGKIQLNYVFKVGQTTIAGVKRVDNQSIPADTLRVSYRMDNPLDNELVLP